MPSIRRTEPRPAATAAAAAANARSTVDHLGFAENGVRPSTPAEQARIRDLLARRARLA